MTYELVRCQLRELNLGRLQGFNEKHPHLYRAIVELTSFLPTKAKLHQRIWHIMNDVSNHPSCPVCDSPLGWLSSAQKQPDGTYKIPHRYSEYCSYKCRVSVHKEEMMAARRASFQLKYGVDNPMQSGEIRQKQLRSAIDNAGVATADELYQKQLIARKSSNRAMYGVDNVRSLETTKTKIKSTLMERYGVENLQSPAMRQKARQTNIDKFGGPAPACSPEVRARTVATNLERYGAFAPALNPEIQQKAVATTIDRYGVSAYTQQTMPAEALVRLNDCEWLTYQHHVLTKTLGEIAHEIGVNITTVANYCDRHGISKKLFAQSSGERSLGNLLAKLGIEFETNNRTVLNGKELDIYIPSLNLAIEYCGLYWHSDKHDHITPSYHADKTKRCTIKGIRLITIFEDELLTKPELVLNKIASIVGKSQTSTTYARKCKVVEVSNPDKVAFFESNHIQGDGPGSITYGLNNSDGQLVACMTFIRKRDGVFVLNRYATSHNVPGGFSKLLKHFTITHAPTEIVSFADLRWSQGDVYHNNGFTLDKVLPPDYYWVVGDQRQHKFAWRHNSRLSKLPLYDASLSESANMHAHGYHKIYNCGLQRWVYRPLQSQSV